MIEIEKEIEQYFIDNSIPLVGRNNKSTVKLVVYGYRDAGWSAGGQASWLNKWFPNRGKCSRAYTHILNLIDKKYCANCDLVKYKEQFSTGNNRLDGLQSWCKNCWSLYRKSEPNKYKLYNAKYRYAKLCRIPPWADLEGIANFYSNCPLGHSVDHIVPLQGNKVSGFHTLENLQYLTHKENLEKGNKFKL